MPIIKVVNGNLLDAKEPIICQQSNCVTMTSYGLAQQIAEKYPWADVYKRRMKTPSVLGTIQVDTHDGKSVIHLFAQYMPGKPNGRSLPKQNDGSIHRIQYFKACLEKMDELELEVVAMPYLIGCGLAGGDWKVYKAMLEACKTNIILYKL